MPIRDHFNCDEDWIEHMRLWFAGMALQGMLADSHMIGIEAYAARAYKYADAMIAEKDKCGQ